MRISNHERHIITESFRSHFGGDDQLWLFGSRVDDTKRGGDIDLYIETLEQDSNYAFEKRNAFAIDLQVKLGLQKIDTVLNIISFQKENAIYDIAKTTGIQLV